MNFAVPDSILGRQRCRQWTPILTQQLRLRHLYQIMLYNATSQFTSSFYYTLHLTTMCAPFYTSNKNDSLNPKWKELDMNNCPHPSLSAFVLRIWQTRDEDMDLIIVSWGIHLSGLVYLGNKLSEIQPESFNENSVILRLRGGFFTSSSAIRTDLQKPLKFIDSLNVLSTEFETKVFRNTVLKVAKGEVKQSYSLKDLQKIHSLQLTFKNQNLNVQSIQEKIVERCGLCNSEEIKDTASSDSPTPVYRHPSQLLTMTTLNKMLQWQEKPTKVQRQRIAKMNKQLEIAKFRTKLLSQERDKKSAFIRQLKQNCSALIDENEERGSMLMESYHKLSRDAEKLKEWKKEQVQLRESLIHVTTQLHHRRRQLMNQLLFIYPLEDINSHKRSINGIYLPFSNMLSDCSDGGLAVALGYVAHVLIMCASFLQVPLRYPITFLGSRSYISDQVTAALPDKERDFPLYAKGKDRMQFNYAVYLLNKDIAQLRWLCGQNTPDLRATLLNLQTLLQGRDSKELHFINCKRPAEVVVERHIGDTLSSNLHYEGAERTQSPSRTSNKSEQGVRRGLNEILSIPEAFMNQQISTSTFKSYASAEKFKKLAIAESKPEVEVQSSSERSSICDTSSKTNPIQNFDIEQGTDILQSSLNLNSDLTGPSGDEKKIIQNRRISRSVGSITEEEIVQDLQSTSLELGSDSLLSIKSEKNIFVDIDSLTNNLEDRQQEFLQKWLDSGPALVCSEENLYPDEILGTTSGSSETNDSSLTVRTDALLNTTSFNRVKPK